MWFLPYLGRAEVRLVTVLGLVKEREGEGRGKEVFLIRSQNDLYQVNEFVKFVSLFGVLQGVVFVWQCVATLFCVIGAGVFWPVSWAEERVGGGSKRRGLTDGVKKG